MAKQSNNGNGKKHATQQSVDQAVKSICDIMRRGNCAGALQYVPELTWILFLRILDERKRHAAEEARPFKEEARKKARQAAECKDKEQAKVFNKESKAAAAKAQNIDDVVYDLKAVNPNKKPVVDTRTPEELLDLIEAKGREIAEALAVLRTGVAS